MKYHKSITEEQAKEIKLEPEGNMIELKSVVNSKVRESFQKLQKD